MQLQHVNRSKKPRQPRQPIPVPGHKDYGNGEDADKWYRCSNCGFLYDLKDRGLGVRDKDSHLAPVAYTQTDQYGNTAYHCIGAAGATQAICEAAGGTWTSTGYKPADRTRGCPLCGI